MKIACHFQTNVTVQNFLSSLTLADTITVSRKLFTTLSYYHAYFHETKIFVIHFQSAVGDDSSPLGTRDIDDVHEEGSHLEPNNYEGRYLDIVIFGHRCTGD